MGEQFAEIVAAPAEGHKVVCASLPDGRTVVRSPEELRQWLRRIVAECPRPLLAEVIRSDGDLLSIGLGRSRSFVTYIPKDGNPPYFSAVDESAGDGEICFDCNGEPSFYAIRNSVPFPLALDVACQFAASSGLPLPELVAWEEV